jgi:CRISPR-associated endonuclease Csn1
MSRILGLDLGTNSIGWAIRETDKLERELYNEQYIKNITELDNEVIDYGVIIFKKGVGEGKSGEFSLAAERRKNRSKRRLYNAKRYRKWQLLKVLIENDMCPLTLEELRLWSIGNWVDVNGKRKNLGRVYPLGNEAFQKWLAFDPMYFGQKDVSAKGKPVRKNPYDLRCELIGNMELEEKDRKIKVGRALYHLVQRRGFKSSRKNGKSTYAENTELEKIKSGTPGFHIATLAKERLDKGGRFRASGVIQRSHFEDEFLAICKKQNIDKELTDDLHKSIYFVRPLRSQKGLVGNCTLENGKARIPLSHPKYEEFRALQFINNIQWREAGSKKRFESIPMSLKKRIFEELFFRRLESGKHKGKIHSNSYFKFDEIINNYSESGKHEFNYKNKPNVSTCPTIAALMNVFDDDWQNKFIQGENSYGINWEGLKIEYTLKYGKLKRKIKQGKKVYIPKNIGDKRILKVDEIWHLLFDYIQTKDQQKELEKFCKSVLGFNDNKTKTFAEIDILQGYGSLSYSAISKIIPFLQNGFIYSEAVLFANLKKVLGEQFEVNKEKTKQIIATAIKETSKTKEKLNIANGLIQHFFADNNTNRAKGLDDHIKRIAVQDTIIKIKSYFGQTDWTDIAETEQKQLENDVLELYLRFLDGKQSKEEKASSGSNKSLEIDYYKLPRVDDVIKQNLKKEFPLSDKSLKHLYHPSDLELYPKSKSGVKVKINGVGQFVKQLESPQPPSKGWKNPMAMRTLHELRHLLNYLLKIGKVNIETKVVVEMARELNDANKRWAIQTYQRDREEENKEFAKAIIGVAAEKYPNLDENNINNINKVRLWWEQLENSEDVYKQIKSLKEDIHKYRLWKEQECQCIYTGDIINLTDLFDGSQTNFEHTLPVSDSFDSSLSNLTVCKAHYNIHVKKNKIPTQLKNYSKDADGYTAILPRLQKWQKKVDHLKNLIDDNRMRSKKTQDPDTKKSLIQKRHLLELDYEYWIKKLKTFTVKEIPNSWKNSQLIDTQIISKYARAYLKTVFEKVEIQKGIVVNQFKYIYQIKGDEQKDRSKHSHHAVDAATLTLIPGSARRETILKEYYIAVENRREYSIIPYATFKSAHFLNIESNIIINHISHDKTLIGTFKNIRKNGQKTGWIAQGASIRGRLHEETYLGAIKPNEVNEAGKAIKDSETGKYLKKKSGDKDVIWTVQRKKIEDVDIDTIVDEALKIHIKKQLANGTGLNNIKDINGRLIRHIRFKKFSPSYDKTIKVKPHLFHSEHEHKNLYLANNDSNYLCLLYKGKDNRGKEIRAFRFINLFEFSKMENKKTKELFHDPEYNFFIKLSRKNEYQLPLTNILKAGQRVILFKSSVDEINRQNALDSSRRMFKIYKFNNSGSDYVFLENIIEARSDEELKNTGHTKDGETEFNPEKYQPRLKLTADNLDCLFEGIDFEIKPDGEIKWSD